jgi:hypothetical protein
MSCLSELFQGIAVDLTANETTPNAMNVIKLHHLSSENADTLDVDGNVTPNDFVSVHLIKLSDDILNFHIFLNPETSRGGTDIKRGVTDSGTGGGTGGGAGGAVGVIVGIGIDVHEVLRKGRLRRCLHADHPRGLVAP